MTAFESIVVTGGSGTGKTTLVNGLRLPKYENNVVIPHRFMTRSERLDDNPEHTTRVGKDEFTRRIASGQLYPHWSRIFGQDRVEHYGFETLEEGDERLPVYAVTNPFLHPAFKDILNTSLIISLRAFPTTRTDRIFDRESDPTLLPLSELSARLLDSEGPESQKAHITLDTSTLPPEEGQAALRDIVDKVLEDR